MRRQRCGLLTILILLLVLTTDVLPADAEPCSADSLRVSLYRHIIENDTLTDLQALGECVAETVIGADVAAILLYAQKKWQESAMAFEDAIALVPNDTDRVVYLLTGQFSACLSMGDSDRALQTLERMIKLSPDNPAFRANHSAMMYSAGKYAEALTSLDKSIALGNETTQAHTSRGKLLDRFRRYPEANEAYDRALGLDHTNAEAWLGKSFAMLELGDDYLLPIWNALDSAAHYDSEFEQDCRAIQDEILKVLKAEGAQIEGINK